MNEFRLSVKALAEFCFQNGDILVHQSRTASATEGQAGQKLLQTDRGPHYQTELHLEEDFSGIRCHWKLTGRADGYDANAKLIEEIKTTYYPKSELPTSQALLHQAQAKIYGALVLRQLQLDKIEIRVSYWCMANETSYSHSEHHTPDTLLPWFEQAVLSYTQWLDQYCLHLENRNKTLSLAVFPFRQFRSGQRQLATSIYRHIRDKQSGYYHAPTGIGKTIATLFPSLKAMAASYCNQIWYLTAKTSGSYTALKTACQLQLKQSSAIKVIQLQAQERLCHCDCSDLIAKRACPLQQGFYDRLPQARWDFLNTSDVNPETLSTIATTHQLCPHQLNFELLPWADLVIADFNYVFDPYVSNSDYFKRSRSIVLLVDEAHNLPDRAREMFSESLSIGCLVRLSKALPSGSAKRRLQKLAATHRSLIEAPGIQLETVIQQRQIYQNMAETLLDWFSQQNWLIFPVELFNDCQTLSRFAQRLGQPADEDQLIQDAEFEFLTLFCTNPAARLEALYREFLSHHLFSGSLLPADYFKRVLGHNSAKHYLEVASPFAPEQQKTIVFPLNTRYPQRPLSLPVCAAMLELIHQSNPGCYLVALPSFEYIKLLETYIIQNKIKLPIQSQPQLPSDEEKTLFLDSMKNTPSFSLVITGGLFAESIELDSGQLTGIVVIGTGMPPPTQKQTAIADHFNKAALSSFDYGYRFPGINKVIQTVGRLIRSEADSGLVILADDRFLQTENKRLLPSHWRIQQAKSLEHLAQLIEP